MFFNTLFMSATLMILSQLIQDTNSLECYECKYLKVLDSGNALVDSMSASRVEADSDERCLRKTKEDLISLTVMECPEPGKGNMSKCAAVDGVIKLNVVVPIFGKYGVKFLTASQRCIEVPVHDPLSTDGCHKEFPPMVSKGIQEEYSESGSTFVDLRDIRLHGQICYTSEKKEDVIEIRNSTGDLSLHLLNSAPFKRDVFYELSLWFVFSVGYCFVVFRVMMK